VGGVSFDALQVGVRVLWEIKTHQSDTYPDFIRDREIEKELKQPDPPNRRHGVQTMTNRGSGGCA
jgi:Family of unknown function (DUF6310)